MKLTRNTQSIIIVAFGVLVIVLSLIQHFSGFGFNESVERRITDMVFFIALILFIRNCKLANEEKEAKIKAERVNHLAKENTEEETPRDNNSI